MGSGCLKPASPKGDIDLSTLDTIYEDAQQVQLPPNCPYQSLELYPIMKERIMKKGHMRKLIDYLSSHRFRICDNLLHSFRIMMQSKSIHSKYVSLLMMNQLFSNIKKVSQPADNQETTFISVQSQFFDDKNGRRKTNISQTSMELNLKNQNSFVEKEGETISVSMMVCEVTSHKFQGIYFNIISHLLKQDNQIYKLTLQNMVKYCSLGKNFFNNEDQIDEIMETILYHIQIDDYLCESLRTYKILTPRIKEHFFSKNINNLRDFVLIWLQNPLEQSIEEDMSEKEEISTNCEYIIECFIKKSVEGWNSQTIYYILFELFDQNCFSSSEQIQNLILVTTTDIDLKSQFYRGLFLHFLQYGSFPERDQLQNVWQTIFPEENCQAFKRRYPNIREEKTKVNALSLVNKWLYGYKFVEVSDLIEYSSNCLIKLFILNLFCKKKQIKNKAISQLIEVQKKMKRRERIIMIDLLLAQMNEEYITDDQRFTILSIAQTFIEKEQFLELPENYCHTIFPLNQQYQYENKLKIIELISIIVRKLTFSYFYCQLQMICTFMHSFYVEIKEGPLIISSKNNLIAKFKDFIKTLVERHQLGIALAFAQKLQAEKENCSSAFYNDAIMYGIMKIIHPSTVLPEQLVKVGEKLKNSTENAGLALVEGYTAQEKKEWSKPQQTDDNYEGAINLFRKKFSRENEFTATASIFMQVKSVMSGRSINDAKEDKQLNEIIDMI